ncbi:phage integrase SAM-like domain-containing protein [Sphingobacterium spiritivorum]|uniref:phage integrase SAM-like domain-containing protein n=1 Tax=Sphingobacterium spiritivorum TaxID=258 RepID=UPI003DA34422
MATIKIVAPNSGLSDVLINYRITHNRKHRYINSRKYISKDMLLPDGSVPLDFIVDYLSHDYKIYKDRLNSIKGIEFLNVDQVKKIVEFGNVHDSNVDPKELRSKIDYVDFYNKRVKKFENSSIDKREGSTIDGYHRAIQKVKKFFGSDAVMVSEMTSKKIKSLYEWMTNEDNEGLALDTAALYMSRLNKVFKDLMDDVNDLENDISIIVFNPFSNIKLVKEKRHKEEYKRELLSLEQLRKLRDIQTMGLQIGRNFFMLSLYMCGANFADIIVNYEKWLSNGERADYERRKVRNKRDDGGFISIKLNDEIINMLKIFKIYAGTFKSAKRYYDRISYEIKLIESLLKLEFSLVPYTARYMFSNIASNDCDFSDDYVSRAMNHSRAEFKITMGYLHNQWNKIDEVQAAVISKVNEDLKE